MQRPANVNSKPKFQFYQMESKNVASMPIMQNTSNFTPPAVNELVEPLDDLSSDREPTNGSKVWGNSVLSANHETPIDNWVENNEDLNEIRKIAANTEIKQFLRKNNLEAFEGLLERFQKQNNNLTLKDLAKYDAHQISKSCSQYMSVLSDGK